MVRAMKATWWRDDAKRCVWYQDEEVKLAITDRQAIIGMEILLLCRPSGHVMTTEAHVVQAAIIHTCPRTISYSASGTVRCNNRMRPMTNAEHAVFLIGGEEALRVEPPSTERAG